MDHESKSLTDHTKECNVLISKTNEQRLDPFDIIADRRSVAALCLLYSSMVSQDLLE